MNSSEFVAGIPRLPSQEDYRSTWLTLEDFKKMLGNIIWGKKQFLCSSGGAADADCFRGFSSTSGSYTVPTTTGWVIQWMDNPIFGSGIQGGCSPSEEEWEWVTIGWSFQEWFVRRSDRRGYEEKLRSAVVARRAYLHDGMHPRFELRFPGWYLEEGTWWIREEGKEEWRVRLWPETDRIAVPAGASPPEWWKEDLTLWQIF